MAMSCGVGLRGSSDLALLWLRYRLAAAALIRPLACELLYVAHAALKRQQKTEKRKKKMTYLNNEKKKKAPGHFQYAERK